MPREHSTASAWTASGGCEPKVGWQTGAGVHVGPGCRRPRLALGRHVQQLGDEALQVVHRAALAVHVHVRLQLPHQRDLPLQCAAEQHPVQADLAGLAAGDAGGLQRPAHGGLPDVVLHVRQQIHLRHGGQLLDDGGDALAQLRALLELRGAALLQDDARAGEGDAPDAAEAAEDGGGQWRAGGLWWQLLLVPLLRISSRLASL
mmetsp:Transcript_12499/g.32010  ORF Transcript_12499/g.32010 Transcript_12499/m.32010 type:complete len:204 (-) Transcript_12499:381-992(-)